MIVIRDRGTENYRGRVFKDKGKGLKDNQYCRPFHQKLSGIGAVLMIVSDEA